MREDIIIVCCSEGTRLVKGRGKWNLENSLRNLDAYLQMLQLSWHEEWWNRQVWFFVKLWGSNQDRNLNWVISRSFPIWRIYGLLMNTCYLKWGCLCIYPSTPPLLFVHYLFTCPSIYPLLSCFKTQWTYFTPLALPFFFVLTSVYWLAP